MSTPRPQLQSILLDLISPIRSVGGPSVQTINAEDWPALLVMARVHRLVPMLHWRLTRERQELPVPAAVKHELAQAFKRSTLRALVFQRELLLVHRILDQAGIAHVALKGAYLAFHAYPQPALRPLRDLDILVPKDQALDAYRVLVASGMSRMEEYPGSPEAALGSTRHLPPLRSRSGQVKLELHSRLFEPEKDGAGPADPSDDPRFWDSRMARGVASDMVPFASATDLLLHLIVHAVYDHQFDNGPLLLSDLAYLLDTQAIDWPLFWALAERGGRTRGCLLALQLTQRYWGEKAIRWPTGGAAQVAPSAARLDAAALLMLADIAARRDVTVGKAVVRQGSLVAKVRILLNMAVPPKATMATAYPVSAQSLQLYLWYPAHWWRLATRRLPDYVRSRREAHLHEEVRQLADLERWMAGQ